MRAAEGRARVTIGTRDNRSKLPTIKKEERRAEKARVAKGGARATKETTAQSAPRRLNSGKFSDNGLQLVGRAARNFAHFWTPKRPDPGSLLLNTGSY